MTFRKQTIRIMKRTDLDIAVEWAAREGWNPGLYDAEAFWAADPTGFFIGEIDGEPVSVISAVKYGAAFAFMGFYIVRPDFRGQGYGIAIWREAIKSITDRNIGLDGVVAEQENYKKSGFKYAYANIRYEGRSGGVPPAAEDIADASSVGFEDILNYDRMFFPEDREVFLRHWLKMPETTAKVLINGWKPAGYGMIRPCRRGYKIGPLFADSPEGAWALFLSLSASVKPEEPVYLDIPKVNDNALRLVQKHGMKPVFETARMYTGEFPPILTDNLYGVTTFELG